MKENMYYGAKAIIFQRATDLRNCMTPSEEILWKHLHINEWKLKFRRQHPVWNYIVDFYCHKIKLVIELDGSIHEQEDVKRNDKIREQELKDFGLIVLRFKNEDIFKNINQVLNIISDTINKLNNPLVEKSSVDTPLGDGGMGRLFVIKIGGNIIDDAAKLSSFLKDFAAISEKKILVHGGGKIATRIGEKLGIESKYVNGRRITDDAAIDLVTQVYGGLVNKKIVAQLQSLHCNAIGLTGADANIIPATKRPPITLSFGEGRGEVDYGWAGDIDNEKLVINNLQLIIDAGITPVFAPLTHDGEGHILNTNADTIASSLAVALSKHYAVRLMYCFEKKGVLENVDDDDSVITHINKTKYQQLVAENKLFEGILPKIDNAFAAIDKGVREVLIGHAADLHQNITDKNTGTLFY